MANPEHLAILKQGVEAWNKWRKVNRDIVPDLIGAELAGYNLEGANLAKADLESVKLERANLRGANLRGANLVGANLRGANLVGANFEGANLLGANLDGAHLLVANFEGANLLGTHLDGANLRVANLDGANLRLAHLDGAHLDGANLRGANLRGANLRGANLRGANLEDANLEDANLDGANLRGANLRGANIERDNVQRTELWSSREYRIGHNFVEPKLSLKKSSYSHDVHPKITLAYPEVVAPLRWSKVDVFLYFRDYRELVQAEIRRLQERANIDYSLASSEFPKCLPIGCPIKISLESTSLRVNPSEVTIHWYEPYNRLSFRISPIDDKKEGYSASLDVDVFADDLPAASMRLAIAVNSKAESEHFTAASSDATWYENIFASYAREDLEFVKHLKDRYEALGMHMFVDLDDLLSGVEWEKALVNKIDNSDLFQLFWSENARQSEYVSVEWKHALRAREIKGGRFIRPVYWDDPIPKVPDELADINFRKIKFVKK